MTTEEYNATIKKLGLTAHGAHTWLGFSNTAAYNYKLGKAVIPRDIARLLRLIKHFKLTPEQASKIWGE